MQAHRNFGSRRHRFSLQTHECQFMQLEFIFLSNLNDIFSWLSSGCFPCCCSISELPIHFQTSEGEKDWQEKLHGAGCFWCMACNAGQMGQALNREQTWEIYPQEINIHLCSSSSISSSIKGSSLRIWVSCCRNSMHIDF